MPAKIDNEANLRFLFVCFKYSNYSAIDYHKVAAHFEIKAPAARMRLMRLKNALEGDTSKDHDERNRKRGRTNPLKAKGKMFPSEDGNDDDDEMMDDVPLMQRLRMRLMRIKREEDGFVKREFDGEGVKKEDEDEDKSLVKRESFDGGAETFFKRESDGVQASLARVYQPVKMERDEKSGFDDRNGLSTGTRYHDSGFKPDAYSLSRFGTPLSKSDTNAFESPYGRTRFPKPAINGADDFVKHDTPGSKTCFDAPKTTPFANTQFPPSFGSYTPIPTPPIANPDVNTAKTSFTGSASVLETMVPVTQHSTSGPSIFKPENGFNEFESHASPSNNDLSRLFSDSMTGLENEGNGEGGIQVSSSSSMPQSRDRGFEGVSGEQDFGAADSGRGAVDGGRGAVDDGGRGVEKQASVDEDLTSPLMDFKLQGSYF